MSETFTKAVGDIIEKSLENTIEQSGDFYKDGILHCGVCGQPKRKKQEFLGHVGEVGIACGCVEHEKAERERALLEARIQRMRNNAFGALNRRAPNMRFDKSKIDTKAIQAARRYAEDLQDKLRNGKGI
ncbi:MAG: hypothetical protein IIU58_01280, partial [Clostridia bacterium]|nr:hypothetical protein [Clostridia bacterium]